jgi:hypothetical protein
VSVAEIINRIIKKFGGNRVEFVKIDPFTNMIEFVLGSNHYDVAWSDYWKSFVVHRSGDESNSDKPDEDNYTRWVQGVLNGGVRNDAGEIVRV